MWNSTLKNVEFHDAQAGRIGYHARGGGRKKWAERWEVKDASRIACKVHCGISDEHDIFVDKLLCSGG